jgi:hypothetical protein
MMINFLEQLFNIMGIPKNESTDYKQKSKKQPNFQKYWKKYCIL